MRLLWPLAVLVGAVLCQEDGEEALVDIYCGDMNCYDLLGVTRETTDRSVSWTIGALFDYFTIGSLS